jgi:phosphonate transport system permease protein
MKQRLLRIAVIAGAVGVCVWCMWDTASNPISFIQGIPQFKDFASRLFPPDITIFPSILTKLKETLQIALVGTVLAVGVSLPISVLASRNVISSPFFYQMARIILDIFRGVSELVWALLFVAMVGLGPFAGVLALTVHNAGALGKYFSEAIENVDKSSLEAISAIGAGRLAVVRYGIFRQIKPYIMNYIFYYFEHSLRQATVLGIVGAGGIGYELLVSIKLYKFQQISSIIIVMLIMVIVVDRLSAYVRKRYWSLMGPIM